MSLPAAHPKAPVAVIGAGGFLGCRLVDALSTGGIPVAQFTRSRPFADAAGHPHPALAGAHTIYHVASSVNIGIAERHPERVAADHQLFLHLLDALARCRHRPAVVLISSGGAVYDSGLAPPYRENSSLRPATAYGWAKVRLEQQLMRRMDIVKPIVVRLSNPYGPGQRLVPGQGVLRHWFEAIAEGKPLQVFGDPAAIRDYVYIDDVIAALVRLAHWPREKAQALVLNIGSGVPTPLAALVNAVRAAAGGSADVEYVAGRYFDRRDTWLDVSAAARSIAWRPTTELAVGLSRMWAERPALVA